MLQTKSHLVKAGEIPVLAHISAASELYTKLLKAETPLGWINQRMLIPRLHSFVRDVTETF